MVIQRDRPVGKRPVHVKLIVLLLVVAYLCNGIAVAVANDRLRSITPMQLPSIDAFLESLPFIPRATMVANMTIIGFVLASSITIYFSNHPLEEFEMIAQILIPFFFFRAIAVVITTHQTPFPDAANRCMPMSIGVIGQIGRGIFVMFEFLDIGESKVLCGDTMFSGHTGLMIIGCWFLYCRGNRQWKSTAGIITLISITSAGMFALLLSRMHYSVDLLIGAVSSIGCISLFGPKIDHHDD